MSSTRAICEILGAGMAAQPLREYERRREIPAGFAHGCIAATSDLGPGCVFHTVYLRETLCPLSGRWIERTLSLD